MTGAAYSSETPRVTRPARTVPRRSADARSCARTNWAVEASRRLPSTVREMDWLAGLPSCRKLGVLWSYLMNSFLGSALDHLGIGVSDISHVRVFYEQALNPLGITLMMNIEAV